MILVASRYLTPASFSVIRQDGTTPIKYGITLDMEAKYSELKPSLSQLCKIPPHNLILVDIVHAQFRVRETFSCFANFYEKFNFFKV